MTDSKGVINQSRSGLSDEKKLFITKRKIDSLEEAMATWYFEPPQRYRTAPGMERQRASGLHHDESSRL